MKEQQEQEKKVRSFKIKGGRKIKNDASRPEL